MKNLKLYIVLLLFVVSNSIFAQEAKNVIHQAMEQEISRNIKNLHLAGMKDPFYIGLDIVDFNMVGIYSSLGALINVSEEKDRVAFNNQVLVGDYNSNNLNYSDPRTAPYYMRTASMLPLDNSLSGIKHKLWLSFDRAYKLSAETFESKQSALKTRSETEDVAGLPDFAKSEKVLVEKPEISLKFNNENLIKYANEISLAFKPYKFLTTSWIRVVGYKANIYYSNSEGTKATYPVSVFRVVVHAESQAPTGEWLEQFRMFYTLNENNLPSREEMIKVAQELGQLIGELQKAPIFDDVYNGPVLFEGVSASEAIRKTLFFARNENLYAIRKPVMGGPVGMQTPQITISSDERIDKRIGPDGLSVKDKPAMTEYNGIQLIGAYPIDMDGIIPPKETVLIENGMLRNLLSGRSPTAKMKVSNGHLRVPMTSSLPLIVPGVIEVDFANGVPKEDLKKKLMEMAKSDGLDYALIVRDITPNQSELRSVYKVDVNTGKEQLVRSAGFNGLTLNDLRKLVSASNTKRVMNTSAGEDLQPRYDYLNGCPATFITPDALLFKDIEIKKSTRTVMKKNPVVKNPLEI